MAHFAISFTISGLAGVIRQSSQAAREIADHTRRQTTGIEQILGAISRCLDLPPSTTLWEGLAR